MFWIPTMVLKRLRNIYVDGLINGVDMKEFVDDFSAQAKAQMTLSTVIMVVNASILAVPGLGSTTITKSFCSISFILNFYCIIAWMVGQHFGHRLRSLDFAVYYLQGKIIILAILASTPSLLYLTGLTFSILGFLAGVFTEGFELPLSAKIGCGLIVVVGMGLMIPLTVASVDPGLIREEE